MTPSTTQYKIKLLQSLKSEDCGKNKQWRQTLTNIITKLKTEAIEQAIKDGNDALEMIEQCESKY